MARQNSTFPAARLRLPAFRNWRALWLALLAFPGTALAQTTNSAVRTEIVITATEGRAEVLRAGAQTWDPAYTNQVLQAGDALRTRENSRVTLLFADNSVARIGPLSEFAVQPSIPAGRQPGFSLSRGLLYFFHRDKPANLRIQTQTAAAAVDGTEFNLVAEDNGRTILTVIDGRMELSNAVGRISLTSGEQGIAQPGQMPVKTAVINSVNIIQWALYYPAVLDVDELELAPAEQQALAASLAAYRRGDLLQALAQYPANRPPASASERIYNAALLLSVGQVDAAEALLTTAGNDAGAGGARHLLLSGALRELIAAVKLQSWDRIREPEFASEWLAESYFQQSRPSPGRLHEALRAARKAVEKSPEFGFGWARVAELEFGFGNISGALDALEKSLQLAPRNPEALTLKGFLLAAKNRMPEAERTFDAAIAVDGALGNAWLGRGLSRIRQGRAEAGRKDLMVAAALEPQRSILRSYLGKAYADAGDRERAARELELAQELDSNDPTVWLYLALFDEQNNRVNQAVRDLEHSQKLNDNRQLYRSKLLLDQDRAVRSANLASIYRDAGMPEVSVREATRAVTADYANYAAHLFLANSYDQLRDPNRINLRYETPAQTEYLVANLLAPVGAGPLSSTISDQEYSKLFERDRFGVASTTEYLSRGAWLEAGSQFGTFGNTAYALEAFYRTDPGQRPNNDFEEREFSLQARQQITSQDSLYLQAIQYEAKGGDLIQYDDPSTSNPRLRTMEKQEPTVLLGYHREWAPGIHTLVLLSRLHDRVTVTNPVQSTFFVSRTPQGLEYVEPMSIHQFYRSTLAIYSAEVQQIWETPVHSTIVGAGYQTGDFRTESLQTEPSLNVFDSVRPRTRQEFTTDFERLSLYGYHHWQVLDSLRLVGGIGFDRLTFPENFRAAPIAGREETKEKVSPRGGWIWNVTENTVFRGAYTRSLSGASIDQSLRLEPTQVGGFNQSFRSILPESIGGAEGGAEFETYGLSLEQHYATGTYWALSGEILNSDVTRTFGVFEATLFFANPGGTRERIRYRERTLHFTFNQLLGEEWSLGLDYRLSDVDLNDRFPEVLRSASFISPFRPSLNLGATLHRLDLHAIYNHPSGFFAEAQGLWYHQRNSGYGQELEGDDFWQANAFAGYRFLRRRAEVSVGILNLAGQDYRLNPLNLYNELPRERTLLARLQFRF